MKAKRPYRALSGSTAMLDGNGEHVSNMTVASFCLFCQIDTASGPSPTRVT
jgi:hypothetical protein